MDAGCGGGGGGWEGEREGVILVGMVIRARNEDDVKRRRNIRVDTGLGSGLGKGLGVGMGIGVGY